MNKESFLEQTAIMNESSFKITKNPKLSKISVVVPIYNSAHTLSQCLQALKNQTDSNYEVIVVNDCSIDDSLRICKESGFKTLSLATNKGQAVARNEGVKNSSGEIIAFVDSDAVVPPDWLEKYRQLLTTHKDADMICSGYKENIADTQPALFAFHEASYRRLDIPHYISSSTSSNCIIYREAFEEVGGYPEYYLKTKGGGANQKAVATNEDAELGFLLSEKGKKIIWSHDNPVKHYFRNSWSGYLKQQIVFSRYAILSLFKFPKMFFSKDIYSKEKITLQLAIVLIMALAILGLLFIQIGTSITVFMGTSGLLILYFLNRKFIRYLKNNMKDYPASRLFFWLLVSRVCWLYGVTLGLKDGCYMLWNNYLMRFNAKKAKR